MTTLSISSLSLHHFRNYASVRMALSPQPVVLTGPNGAGKTNILEALSLLSPGRGLRRARLAEMNSIKPSPSGIGQGEGQPAAFPVSAGEVWAISAQLRGLQGEVQIGTGLDPESGPETDKRLVRIDGKPQRSQALLAEHMVVLWLTPQMEQLFLEGASSGRKFLDRLVYGFEPEHASRVNEYEYAMRERNRLMQTQAGDGPWLDALEQTMAETGCAIAASRLQTAHTLNEVIAASPLSFPKARLALRGLCEEALEKGASALEVEDLCKTRLKNGRNLDAAAGRTLHGAHRSELAVTHLGKHMPAEQCSTGEQKAVLLSIVLAQARASARYKGVVPLLLLDEVAAHLDPTRKLELFEEICQIGAQVWMTGADAKYFAELGQNAQRFHVENGTIF